MIVSQVTVGRFHHFHLARQLERAGVLGEVVTGFPRLALRGEGGIPREKIRAFPWLQGPYMVQARFFPSSRQFVRDWAWWAHETLDAYAARRFANVDAVIALSGSGLRAGRRVHAEGGSYVCDRGSSHIRSQNALLLEEYARWKVPFPGVDPRIIAKEEEEYEEADRITVPSAFAYQSFLAQGVPEQKLSCVPYGVEIGRFERVADPDDSRFDILFVGGVSVRKGFLYLLDAFRKFNHPAKRLRVIGLVQPEMRNLLRGRSLAGVEFLGNVRQEELRLHYSRAHVFVLPSVEEGFGMVMGEAMACGCPVVATTHTGAADILSDGVEGFILPVRDSGGILTCFERLAQNPGRRERMSAAAQARALQIGGWDQYGADMLSVLRKLQGTGKLASPSRVS